MSILYIQAALQRCSHEKALRKNMHQIHRRTPMPKCDLNKTAVQLY